MPTTTTSLVYCPFTYFLCISFYRDISRNYLVQYWYSGFTKISSSQRSPTVLQNAVLSVIRQYPSGLLSWGQVTYGRGSPIPAQAPYGDSVRLLVALCKKTTHPAISGWKGQYPSGPLISNSHSLSVLSIIQTALLLYYMHQPVMPDFQPDLKAQTCLQNKMINR